MIRSLRQAWSRFPAQKAALWLVAAFAALFIAGRFITPPAPVQPAAATNPTPPPPAPIIQDYNDTGLAVAAAKRWMDAYLSTDPNRLTMLAGASAEPVRWLARWEPQPPRSRIRLTEPHLTPAGEVNTHFTLTDRTVLIVHVVYGEDGWRVTNVTTP